MQRSCKADAGMVKPGFKIMRRSRKDYVEIVQQLRKEQESTAHVHILRSAIGVESSTGLTQFPRNLSKKLKSKLKCVSSELP